MAVIRLDLAYDGTGFRGWARQRGARTVQGVIEDALARMLGPPPKLSVAGRTDAGVHAAGQVASLVVPDEVDPARIQRMLNGVLTPEIVVRRARREPDGFDARFSATGREYLYRLDTADVQSPFDARYVWYRQGPLSAAAMRRAARTLVGEHDFASFCRAPQSGGGTVRHLRRLAVRRAGTRYDITAEANAFLHQMVRSLVGTLVAVGEGRIDPDSMGDVLAARRRGAAGPVAPAHGLKLVRVRYGRGRGDAGRPLTPSGRDR